MQRILVALAIATGSAAFPFASSDAHMQASCVVSTPSGDVQGIDRGSSCAFLGIPFAAPPVGGLRWRPPQRAAAWAPTVLNATAPPANCPSFNLAGLPAGSEDCLKMNIWTPDPPRDVASPVIVWFHPGSFVAASANLAAQNGQNLAAQTGAIVVAPNYRLGPFGFLGHRGLTTEDPAYASSANYGLLDQRAALEWVREHIAAFGGDPHRVTIAGQSAGGHSVSLHLVSPGSAGLFDRAIMQGGYASSRWRTLAEAESQGERFAAALGCPDDAQLLPCLRGKSRDQLLRALPGGMEQFAEGRTQWGPVVDGLEIPDQPRALYEGGAFNRVPVILGGTRDEGWNWVDRSFPAGLTGEQYEAALATEFGADAPAILSTYPPADYLSPKHALARLTGDVEYVCEVRRLARLIERTHTPAHVYSFDYAVDGVVPGQIVHGFDVNFVFANNFAAPSNYVLTEADLGVARSMGGYWTRFAATGNPNTEDGSAAHWPRFTHPEGQGRGSNKYLVIDATIREDRRSREAFCDFWEPFFLRSVTGAVPASTPQ